jgi:hypothetical protein
MAAGLLAKIFGHYQVWHGPCTVVLEADQTVGDDSCHGAGAKMYAPPCVSGRVANGNVCLLKDGSALMVVPPASWIRGPRRPWSRAMCRVAAIVFISIMASGCGRPAASVFQGTAAAPADSSASPISMSAWDLFREYGDNEIGADAKYKGKLIKLSGTLEEISSDATGRYLGLAKVGDAAHPTSSEPPGIRAYVGGGPANAFTSAKKGTPVVLVGKVRGKKTWPGAWQGYLVFIDECRPD